MSDPTLLACGMNEEDQRKRGEGWITFNRVVLGCTVEFDSLCVFLTFAIEFYRWEGIEVRVLIPLRLCLWNRCRGSGRKGGGEEA